MKFTHRFTRDYLSDFYYLNEDNPFICYKEGNPLYECGSEVSFFKFHSKAYWEKLPPGYTAQHFSTKDN